MQFSDIVEFQNKVLFLTNDGVYQFNQGSIKKLIHQEDLTHFIKNKNILMVCSIYGEFFRLKKDRLQPLDFNRNLRKRLQNKIINTIVYADSTIWISTVIGAGIIKVDQKKKEITSLSPEREYSCYLYQLDDILISGNNMYASKNKLGIQLDKKSFYVSLAENSGPSKTNALTLTDGSYLFTKQHEAIRINKKGAINRIFLEKNIEQIFQDSKNRIWFALNNGGVICFQDGSFNFGSSVRYLGNKTIISINQDHKNNMWFGTSGEGVYRLELDPYLQYDSPKIFSSLGEEIEKIKSSVLEADIQTSNQASKILRTDIAREDSIFPTIFINNIKVNGTDTTVTNYLELNHDFNNLEINISGLVFDRAELQYKYMLEGYDKTWNYSTNTSIHYTSLLPGKYTFKAFAMSDNGIWSRIPAIITFRINPPIYSTSGFIILAIIFFLIVVLFVLFIINRRKQKRQHLLEEEKRKVLTSELHALRSQMNPHFIFNTLSSIQSFIIKNSGKDAIYFLSKFSKLVRGTLENTQKQTISIKDEIEMLQLYMDLEKLRLNDKFDYRIITDKEIDLTFEHIPPMLIQPYIENAIWHGISNKKGLGLITVTFKMYKENLLMCEILDNGIGRRKSQQLSSKTKKRTSLGMSITKERLEIINSLKKNSLSVNVVDMEDHDGISKGTKVELFVPLN